jgi:uncharacterized protein
MRDKRSSEPVEPFVQGDRLQLLDALRGFALAGVLLMNLGPFTLFDFLDGAQKAALPTASFDRPAEVVVRFLVHGKAMTVFTLLFGAGFALQLARADRRGEPLAPSFLRRIAVLFLFGSAHAYLLWWGDILRFYALLGPVLLLLRRAPTRVLLPVWFGIAVVLPALRSILLPKLPDVATASATLAAFQGGSFSEMLRFNAARCGWTAIASGLPFLILGRFLLGFWAGRAGLFHDPARHRPLLRGILVLGLAAGVPGSAVSVAMELFGLARQVPALATGPAAAGLRLAVWLGPLGMGAAYAAGFALLFLRPGWRARLSVLAPVGRMSLTNYLLQTVICVPVFYGWGLGIGPRYGMAGWLAAWALLFGAQIAWSRWWLARFRFGPVEWLWRSLAFGRFQPLALRVPYERA